MEDQEDQEVQQRGEATESPGNWIYEFDHSSVYSISLFLVSVLCIAVGIGFSIWNGNSNTDTSVSKSSGLMAHIEDFFRWFRN